MPTSRIVQPITAGAATRATRSDSRTHLIDPHEDYLMVNKAVAEHIHWIKAMAAGEQSALAQFYEATCAQVHGLVLTSSKTAL